jgi:hypothetical protein
MQPDFSQLTDVIVIGFSIIAVIGAIVIILKEIFGIKNKRR